MTPYVSGIAVLSYLSGKLPSYDGKRLRTAAGMCSLSLPPGCRTRGLFLAVDLFRGLFHMFHDVPCCSEGVQRPARFSDCIRPCRCGVYPGFQQSFRHIDLAESDVYVGDRLAVEVAVDFRIFSAVGEVECTEDGDGCCDGREERGKTDTPALPGMAFGFTFCPPEETFGEQGIREACRYLRPLSRRRRTWPSRMPGRPVPCRGRRIPGTPVPVRRLSLRRSRGRAIVLSLYPMP